MNDGHAGFFVRQSVRDTRKPVHTITRSKSRGYKNKHFPAIRRSARFRETEPIQDTIGPILVILFAIPLLFFLGFFFYPVLPFTVLLIAASIAIIMQVSKRKNTEYPLEK